MMLGKVTAFLKQPLPCKVKGTQWLLMFVAHCHPLIVNSVSPIALLNNCLDTGDRPPGSQPRLFRWAVVLIKLEPGEDTVELPFSGWGLGLGVQTTSS